LGLFDDSIRLTGFTITKTGAGMTIVDGCNGITPLSLLVAGLLAFPTAWRARAIGLLVGVPAVFAINFLRVFALFVINAEYPEWYSGTHLYVAQAFVILATGGIWLWWLGRFAVGRNEAIDRTDS